MVKNKRDHVLVIRLSAMGDVAMTVPVLLAVIEAIPEIKLTVLTRPFFSPLFKDIPNCTVVPIDLKVKHKGVIGIYRLAKELKKIPFTQIADLHNVLRTNLLKLFFWGSGRQFIQIEKGRAEKKRLTSWTNKEFKPLKTTHERYAEVFRKLGFTVRLSKKHTLQPQQLPKSVKEIIDIHEKKLIGLAPFAAHSGKMYPLELTKEVVQALNNTNKYNIILFGGGEVEHKTLQQIAEEYTNCYNGAGALTFEEELSLISNLDLMISMDSGNGHLAAVFGIPILTLWGVTHPYAGFAPYGQPAKNSLLADREKYPLIPTSVYGNKQPKGYEKVMETISPSTVFQKIETMLSEK